jgi:large conductance mechanosensitive channel
MEAVEKSKAFVTEFKAFLTKTNALALAIGVVIGAAFGGVVKAVTDGLVMPLVELVMPANRSWESMTVGPFRVGIVLGAALTFLVTAFVIFLIMKAFLRPKPAGAPTMKECPQCCESIPIAAKRCRACTATL